MPGGHHVIILLHRNPENVLRWQTEYLDKQAPTLPASFEGFAKKVKPLYRLTEREMAAYAVINRIDYIVEECPMAKGSKMLVYKEVLNRLEAESPGTKQAFYWGFLEKQASNKHTTETMAELTISMKLSAQPLPGKNHAMGCLWLINSKRRTTHLSDHSVATEISNSF